MAKISRKDIEKTLEEMPIDKLLLGNTSGIKLTHKQKNFAKGIAKGLTQAEAYRQAYDTNASPRVVASNAYNLAQRNDIQMIAEAYKRAFEAREYQKPAQIRELLVHQLTVHALSEEIPPAQRIKSLELLGKLSDVGAFTERKETTVVHESSKIKAKLLDQLKTIINGDIKEVNTNNDADSLLAELMGNEPSPGTERPVGEEAAPPPGIGPVRSQTSTHTIPHTQSTSESNVTGNINSEGEGVKKNVEDAEDVVYREGPHDDLGTMA